MEPPFYFKKRIKESSTKYLFQNPKKGDNLVNRKTFNIKLNQTIENVSLDYKTSDKFYLKRKKNICKKQV